MAGSLAETPLKILYAAPKRLDNAFAVAMASGGGHWGKIAAAGPMLPQKYNIWHKCTSIVSGNHATEHHCRNISPSRCFVVFVGSAIIGDGGSRDVKME